jgi:hypothetical protein
MMHITLATVDAARNFSPLGMDMKKITHRNPVAAALFGIAILLLSAAANADPSFRVARVGYLSGPVSFAPAGTDDWVLTTINRPLVTGDRLWADAGARAELQAGGSTPRLGDSTSLTLLNIDNAVTQLQLAQGTLNFRVRRLAPGEIFEVDTPNLAFTVQRPGAYRIDVDPAGNATTVVVRNGLGEVTGEGAAYLVDPQTSYRFAGSGLGDYDSFAPPPADDFDRWAGDRDRRGDNSISMRYVSPDVVGYEDLDDQGTWRNDPENGNIWVPAHVAAGWSPYHDGHWAWIDPYGWTWVDDAPWGFAVSHYGRWAYVGGGWGWVPGPIAVQPVYAPALVAFVGGSGFSLALSFGGGGGVAWFPLGPRDVYRPAYPVSRDYFTNINNSNTRITNTNITNVYNTTNITNITYVNQKVPGAVIAVPAAAFSGSRPVAQAAVPVSQAALAKATLLPVAAVAPTPVSVSGAAKPGVKPPAAAMERPMVAKTAPPPAPLPFAAKQKALAANPGKPLDAQAQAAIKPATPVPFHQVTVIKAAPKPAAPPPPRPASAPGQPRNAPPAGAPRPPEAKPSPAPANVPRPPEVKQTPETKPAPAEQKNVPRPPESRPAPEAKPVAPAPKAESKPDARPPEAKPAPKPEPEVRPPEAKPAPRPEPKLEARPPEQKPAPKPEPKPEPKPQARPPEPAQHATPPHEEHKPEPKKEEKKEEKKE